MIPEEIIYQRFLRDSNNRYIKLFNNTIISCHFSPKQKELFFICKQSIYRCRVYKWNEYVSDLINNQQQLQLALKVCTEIYYNRLNIFLEPVYKTDKTMKVLVEVGRIYVKKRFEMMEKLKVNRARNIESKDEIKHVLVEVH
jgi:hypothetical protein